MATSIFEAGPEARLGALNIIPLIDPPPLPNIIAEWAAVIPLVVHLASFRGDYITVGELALLGKLSIGLFPRLGILGSFARLLHRGPEFVDQASTKGSSNRTVWDVRWGSVFPAANGAAITAIIKYVRERRQQQSSEIHIQMHDGMGDAAKPQTTSNITGEKCAEVATTQVENQPGPRAPARPPRNTPSLIRNQTLHVLRFKRTGHQASSFTAALDRMRFSTWYNMVFACLMSAAAIALIPVGVYGTAVILVTSAILRVLCLQVEVVRPQGYLVNNEDHDACMLLAAHENALEWYLNVGDRSVVDTLLNKPMIDMVPGAHGGGIGTWFNAAHVLQLAAMTFAAGQKGWDGVSLMALLAVDRACNWHFRGRRLAKDWLEREGIEVELTTFVSSAGRTSLMGAIQLYSGSDVTRWMDQILVPHPRRDAWLKQLAGEELPPGLTPEHVKWVEKAVAGSRAGAEIMRNALDAEGV
jgi:hypothetical protein